MVANGLTLFPIFIPVFAVGSVDFSLALNQSILNSHKKIIKGDETHE